VLALAWTGSILGPEFAFARLALCLLFGIGIGWVTAVIFWRDDASHDAEADTTFAERASGGAGPAAVAAGRAVGRHARALAADGRRRQREAAAALGRGLAGLAWEAWRFVKQIFPLLVAGVFVVGVVRQLIQPEWIRALAGANDLAGNAVAVAFGVFMYFPTLVEVPVAHMFLDLGMHRGPLLAYLMADPELSLQSILMVAAVIGRPKTFSYVGLVALFSIVAGLVYGAWVDGANPVWLTIGLASFVGALALLLRWMRGRRLAAAHA
jgi:uncharacterized membrane protein YraQ (UPF0718 family)